MKCKYCKSEKMVEYLKVITSDRMKKQHQENYLIPAYSFHHGFECADCGKWQLWKKHSDDLIGKKFILK